MRLAKHNAAGFTAAMAAHSHVLIDKSFTISSIVTIPVGVTVTITNGAVINAPAIAGNENGATLNIEGRIIAPPERIFANGSSIRYNQEAAVEVYAEWWGAKRLQNIRTETVAGNDIDSADAFDFMLDSIHNRYYADGKHSVLNVRLQGMYGLTRVVKIHERQANMRGFSSAFNGSGFKFIGTLTGNYDQQYLLEYSGGNFSEIENVAFRGKRTTNDAIRLKAAVNFIVAGVGSTPNRHIYFTNICIGDGIGNWGDSNSGYEFENGFSCGSTGLDVNNDFFDFYRIKICNVNTGFLNGLNMAVNWTIKKYNFEYGETMVSYPQGGTLVGEEWYASTNSYGYLIKGGADNTRTFRLTVNNFDSEHVQGDGLIWSDGTVRVTLTNGHINNDGINAPGDGFKLLAGNACIYNPQLTFHQITFLMEGTQKAYFDCSAVSAARGYFRLIQCTSVEGLWVKLPTAPSRATYYLDVDGRNIISDSDRYHFLKLALNNSHPAMNVSTGFVSMTDLLATGTIDLPFQNLNFGNKGYGAILGFRNYDAHRVTTAATSLTFTWQIPANVNVMGVTVTCKESGVIPPGGYIKVGTVAEPEKFGRITSADNDAQNDKKSTAGLVYAAPTSIVMTAFTSGDVATNITAGKIIMLNVVWMEPGLNVKDISMNAVALLPLDGSA